MEPRHRGQWRGRANFIIRVPPPIDFQMLNGALRLPPGLADGFGLKGTSPTRWREIHPLRWWVPRSVADSAVPPSRQESGCLMATRDCDYNNILPAFGARVKG